MKRIAIFLILALTANSIIHAQKSDGVDDYIRFAPWVATYAMKAAGVESDSNWKRLAINSAASIAICCGSTFILKHAIHKDRPDMSDNHSFPSGHTSFAFAGAQTLHKEFGHISPWISVAGYAVATFTGVDRIVRDRHDWFDVVSGAALGIASTEIGYWIGDRLTGERGRVAVAATPRSMTVLVNF